MTCVTPYLCLDTFLLLIFPNITLFIYSLFYGSSVHHGYSKPWCLSKHLGFLPYLWIWCCHGCGVWKKPVVWPMLHPIRIFCLSIKSFHTLPGSWSGPPCPEKTGRLTDWDGGNAWDGGSAGEAFDWGWEQGAKCRAPWLGCREKPGRIPHTCLRSLEREAGTGSDLDSLNEMVGGGFHWFGDV